VILPGTIISIVLLGALSTGFANIPYFRLIQDVGASTAAAVDYVVPVFAVLFGILLLAEPITLNIIAGGLTVIVGMAIAEGRLRRRARQPHDRPRSGVDATTGS
jgi:drug/metabolite transporter (DMT)-like permease